MTLPRVSILVSLAVVLSLVVPSSSFWVSQAPLRPSSTVLSLFGGLKDAFKNDDSLSARQNAGLKNGPNFNEQVTVNGKAVQGAVVGQKLTVVAGRARVKIPVNCQNGECGTCMVKLNGRKVKGKTSHQQSFK
jgi:ferredoxin